MRNGYLSFQDLLERMVPVSGPSSKTRIWRIRRAKCAGRLLDGRSSSPGSFSSHATTVLPAGSPRLLVGLSWDRST